MKTAIILAMCAACFAGCRTDHSTSSKVPATSESFAKKIEQFNFQQERVEQLAAHWPDRDQKFLDSIHAGRIAWADYLRVEPEQRAFLSSRGALDEEYYEGQEKIIDAFSRQWQLIEDLMTKKP